MTPEERLRALRDPDRWRGDAAQPPRQRHGSERLRAAAASLVVLALIVAVVGGLSRLPHAAPPASPSPSPTAVPTVDPDGPVPWDPALVQSYRLYSKADAAAVRGCTSTQLRTWAQTAGGGALGTFYQGVFIRNTGPLCSLARAGIRLDVGDVASRALSIGGNGSDLLPTGATERLQASHVEDCNGGEQAYRELPQEPLSLRIGGTVRNLATTMPFGLPCDLGFETWQLTEPTSEYEREPGFTTDLAVSVPAIPDAYTGGAFDYTVTLRNTTGHPVALRSDTTYRQIVFNGRVASVTTATLPVGTGRTIAPGDSVGFRMHVPAPGSVDSGYWIGWYLSDGTGGVAAQV